MTTVNEAREAIYERFNTNWSAFSTSYVTRDNEMFRPTAGQAWIRLTVRHGGRRQESLGGTGQRKFDALATLFIQIFVPLDSGTKNAGSYAQAARAIFEGVHMVTQEIRFNEGIVRELGAREGYYQVNVEFPFNYTETK